MPSCHVVEFDLGDEFECKIYDKNAMLNFESSKKSEKFARLYERNIYSKRELLGYKLKDDQTKLASRIKSADDCWEACLREKVCEAVSFKKSTPAECFLLKQGGEFKTESSDEFVTVTFEMNFAKIMDLRKVKLEKTRLRNHFESFREASEKSCWTKCHENSECVAISYMEVDSECYFYRKGEYQLERDDKWTTLTFDHEEIDQVYTVRYEDTKLMNAFRSTRAESDYDCWDECSSSSVDEDRIKCVAISFSHTTNECLMYKRATSTAAPASSNLHKLRLDGWVTLAYETELLDSVYFNRTQVKGLYMAFNVLSENMCWSECLARANECVAISYGEKRCHLIKKGVYSFERFNNWVTIYLEAHSPPRLFSHATYKFEK